MWIDSFKAIREIGVMNVLRTDNDSKAKVVLFLIVTIVMAGLISYGLFKVGKKKSETLSLYTRNK